MRSWHCAASSTARGGDGESFDRAEIFQATMVKSMVKALQFRGLEEADAWSWSLPPSR
jgi:hypothetical protein